MSWRCEGGAFQTAYRVRVDGLWDSGRVESSNTVDVVYGGPSLPPCGEFTWTVEVWDGPVSSVSAPARFRTGPAWTAQWILRDRTHDPAMPVPGTDEELDESDPMMRRLTPCPYLRREFVLSGAVRRAVVYATARGVFELSVNGARVGDAVLAPGWTDYRKRIEYATYDVTGLVRPGSNALEAVLGDGWYAGFVGFDARRPGNHYGAEPELLCELHVEYADGASCVIASDSAWTACTGPIVYSDLLMGERHDARRGLGRAHPVLTRPLDDVLLVPERAQPIRVTEDVESVSVTGRIVDFGQNMVGWARLRVSGERGTRVQLRFAEALEADGSLYVANLRGARQLDTYVLSGEGVEEWEPRFTFHGFRYVEVTGVDEFSLTGRVVGSDTPAAGSFECSDELVNQLWRNIRWGQRGNFLSVPTDCPQRDERLGWLADAQVFLPTAMLNMDVAAFITKWGDDILDAQFPDGAYPDVAPRLVMEREGAAAWADAGVIVPWLMWQRYGDVRFVERHWDAMERWMAYLVRHNPDLLWTARRGNDYGDWLSVGAQTPRDVLATAYWAYDASLMASMAGVLGRVERVEHYERLRSGIVAAFNRAYVGEDAYIEGDTQTVYLLALRMGLLAEELRPRAAARLVENIARNDGHLTTGFVGVGLLCPVLSEYGYSDVAHRLLRADTFPSWGYSIRHGATTIWERWDGWTEDAGFQTPMMNSFNHYSLGSVGQWLYENVAGIRPAAPGYARVLIAPEPGELSWARAVYRSVRGPIESSWRRTGDAIELEVSIPANVSATVIVPGSSPVEVGPGRHHLGGVRTTPPRDARTPH
ncbi:family 78 glycoside hydrolase catalytic domain [Solirubrobacter soli]|uniref:family 78 glycoside hydrolase catalytic domain n=1 Tax=Solirubrobacter soli TaxID=363832 RepID=UPI00069D69F9|nr:family 78 glycoside hydrolase catalytic domain [Solirubrobacter soli]